MDPYIEGKGKNVSQFYLMAGILAVFIGAMALLFWSLIGWLVNLVIKYWWVAILTLLIILFIRRRRKK